MKRKASAMILLAALSGCVSSGPGGGPGAYMNHVNQEVGGPPPQSGPEGAHCGAHLMNGASGLVGPGGQPVMACAPARLPEATPQSMARDAVAQGLPPGVLDEIDKHGRGSSGIMQASANMPGPMAGPPMMGGPGGPPMMGGPGGPPPGAVAAVGALTGAAPTPFPVQRTSVRFVGPSGMKISWFGPTADGKPGFGADYLTAPGRYNFLQAAIYRLKLTDIPQRPGLELYPTLEVVPTNNKTATFLAHSSVPLSITEEDLNQVAAGNFVVKVIYLPDPQYQDLASTGAEEIISSRLEPGADPIAEACRRGSILLVVRIGNILLELPNTPAMDAPSPFQPRPPMMPGMGMGAGMPGMPGMPPGMPGMPPGMSGLGDQVPPFGLTGNPPPGIIQPGMIPPAVTAPAPPAAAQPGRVPQGLMPLNTLPADLMPRIPPQNGPGSPVGQMLPEAPSGTTPASLTVPSLK